MVEFVLHDAGMKALCNAFKRSPVKPHAAIPDVSSALHPAAQARHGQTAFPSALDRAIHDLDNRVDENRERRRVIERFRLPQPRVGARNGRLKDDDPQIFVHLRRGKAGAVGVDHGFDHVFDKAPDIHMARIRHFSGALGKHGMAHARNFSDRHAFDMQSGCGARKGGQSGDHLLSPAPLAAGPQSLGRRPLSDAVLEVCLQIIVRDNNVDQALKALKKKMQREGLFREMKLRNHYEKPSERRAREKAEAIRRARKLQRKKMQREGLLPRTK